MYIVGHLYEVMKLFMPNNEWNINSISVYNCPEKRGMTNHHGWNSAAGGVWTVTKIHPIKPGVLSMKSKLWCYDFHTTGIWNLFDYWGNRIN